MAYNVSTNGIVKSKQFMIGLAAASVLAIGAAVPAVGALDIGNGNNTDTQQSSSEARGALETGVMGSGSLQGNSQNLQGDDESYATDSSLNGDLGAGLNAEGNTSQSTSNDDESSNTESNANLGAGANLNGSVSGSSNSSNGENDENESSTDTNLQGGLNLDLGLDSGSSSYNDGGLLNISL